MPVEREDDHYRIKASLVHALILSIFAALLSIAGYMTVWGLDDRAYKADIIRRVTQAEDRNEKQDSTLDKGILPRTEERLSALEKRVSELERKLNKE